MAHANVSNGVLTIISSFANGLDVLRKLRRSGKKVTHRPKTTKRNDEDALRLSRSLRHGPEEIGREYQFASMHCDSEQYAAGDATAQTSLAEILLKLNTGLVGIITSFLSRDKKNGLDLDYQSLTDLSEQSRLQTIGVLRQLYQRLMSRRVLPLVPRVQDDKTKPKPRPRTSTKDVRKRQPKLALVMIENSSIPSQIAMVRPSEARKQRSTTHSRSSSEAPKSHSEPTPAASNPELPTLPPPYFPSNTPPKQAVSYLSKPPRHQTSSISLLKPHITPKHDSPSPLPVEGLSPLSGAMYSSAKVMPSPSRTNIRNPADPKPQRIRPDTYYSIDSARTGSTKLGEIPMKKWAEPWDYEAAERANAAALASGWPTNTDEGLTKSKQGGWKRWFGRRAEVN